MKSVLLLSFLIISIQLAGAEKDTLNHKNEGAIVISDFMDGSLQLRYERKFYSRYSLCFGVSYKGVDGLVDISGLNTEYIKTNNITYSGLKLLAELRYYLTGTRRYNMDGFYTGLYSKSSFFGSNINGTFTDDQQELYFLNLDAKIQVQSYGFLIGYKLALTKRLNMDFLIAGPGLAYFEIDLKSRASVPAEFYEFLNSALKDFSFFDITNPDFNFEHLKTKSEFSTVSLRYGITIGYTF